MELISQQAFANVQLDEIVRSESYLLVGNTVGSTRAHQTYNLLIVAIQSPNRHLFFNPAADHPLAIVETIIVMGHSVDIEAFRKYFGV